LDSHPAERARRDVRCVISVFAEVRVVRVAEWVDSRRRECSWDSLRRWRESGMSERGETEG
jgi:hypothetical protein